jgi:metallo-beta-lactamase family protein
MLQLASCCFIQPYSEDRPAVLVSKTITNEARPVVRKLPYIQFLGAAQMVGGSCYLIDTGKTRILIDYGLYYGSEYEGLNGKLSFDPKTIDHVLLTHAHIDHTGQLPILYKQGFKGKVMGTDATKSILGIMLEMSLNISKQQEKKLYNFEDFSKTMNNYMTVPYDQIVILSPDLSVRYRDAGHILGSSIIEIWIKLENESIKVVTTGDLGSKLTPVLRDPTIITDADYILVESTYGAINRKEPDYKQFGKDIRETILAGGSVLIPAFVLEKTQKVIYVIGTLINDGIIPQDTPVYVDSGTAKEINKVYRKYREYYDQEAREILSNDRDPLFYPSLKEVSAKDALKTHKANKPAIYISSSGMLDHSSAPKHLSQLIENKRNLLAIVGWQSPDSLGRKLQDGASSVIIPIEEFKNGNTDTTYIEKPVMMKIKSYGEFSSHADGCQIIEWLSNFKKNKNIFVVHGEKKSSDDLSLQIQKRLGFHSNVPNLNDIIYLDPGDKDYQIQKSNDFCGGFGSLNMLNNLDDQ